MIAQKLRKLVFLSSIIFVIFTFVLGVLLLKNLKSAFDVQFKEFSVNVLKSLEFQFSQKTKELQRTFDNLKSLFDRLPLSEEEYILFKESLMSNLKALNIDFLAIYENSGLLEVHHLNERYSTRIENLLNQLSLKQLTGKTHFFLDIPNSSFPVELFVLYPSPKILKLWEVETPSVILVGKYRTVTDFVKLEELTGSSVSYSARPGNSHLAS
jgi:hypothetical protein